MTTPPDPPIVAPSAGRGYKAWRVGRYLIGVGAVIVAINVVPFITLSGLAAVGLALAASALSAGRASAHPGLSSPETNACYRAIPPARAAVHDPHATLIGVHRPAADDLPRRLPSVTFDGAGSDPALCAVALRGSFGPGQVDLAPAGAAGRFAVVLVTSSRLQVMGAVVLDEVPRAFGGRTV